MARNAHEIAVNVTANNDDLRKGMAQAARTTQRFASTQSRLSKKREQEIRREVRYEHELQRARDRGHSKAIKQWNAEQAALERLGAKQRSVGGGAGRFGGRVGAMASRAGGVARGMVGTALGAAGVMGGMSIVNEVRSFEKILTDLMITGGKNNEWLSRARDTILSVSDATGKGKLEVASYMQAIVEQTGDAKFALDTLKQMGDVAVGTGANMGDLGGVMVKLGGSMKLAGKDAYQAMNILRAQEKLGSVTMGNISQVFGRVASLAPQFGRAGMGLQGVRGMGALLQLTARGGSREEVGTSATRAQRFLQNLAMRRKKIEKAFDVSLGTGSGANFQFNNLESVYRTLAEAFASKKDVFTKKGTSLFGLQGVVAAQQLQLAGIAGWNKQQGTFASAGSLFTAGKTDELAKDASLRRKSLSFKWEQTTAKLSNAIQRHALPIIERLTDNLPKIMEALQPVGETMNEVSKELVKHLPDILTALKFVAQHLRELALLWLGSKGVSAIKGLAGAGGLAGVGGGAAAIAAGSGAGAGGTSRGARIAGGVKGGVLSSLPLIPFAVSMGTKIGERLAGFGASKLNSMIRGNADWELQSAEWKRNNMLKRRGRPMVSAAMQLWFADTEQGALTKKRSMDLLGKYGSFGTDETGKTTGGKFAIGQLFAQKGISGARAWKDQLLEQRSVIMGRLAKENASIGMPTDEATLEKQMPLLAIMRQMSDAVDKHLATFASGKNLKISVNANVNVGSQPGERSKGYSNPGETRQTFGPQPGSSAPAFRYPMDGLQG